MQRRKRNLEEEIGRRDRNPEGNPKDIREGRRRTK